MGDHTLSQRGIPAQCMVYRFGRHLLVQFFSLRRVRLNELQRWDPFAEIGHLAAAKICFADEADFFSCLFFSYVAPGQLDLFLSICQYR